MKAQAMMSAMQVSLDNLPVELRLGDLSVRLDHFLASQIPAAYHLVCAEAGLGKDVGQDEFPSESHLLSHIQHAHSFSFTDTHTGALQAFLTLVPSDYSRSICPLLVDGTIICDIDIKPNIIKGLIQVGLGLTAELGYEAVLAEVYSTSDLVRTLRLEGFNVVGCIPSSGRLNQKGWTDSFVMFKDLGVTTTTFQHIPIHPQPQPTCGRQTSGALHPVETHRTHHDGLNPADFFLPVIPKLSHLSKKPPLRYFPHRHAFTNDTQVTFRYVQEEDIPRVYRIYKDSAERANGFSPDEFSTMDIFRFYVIDHAHAIIAEDTQTSEILLALSITPSTLCRSADPLLADGYVIVDLNQQNRGIGSMVSGLVLQISKDLGYRGVLTDVLADNLPALRIFRRLGFAQVGYIPKAAKGQDEKPKDIVILYKGFFDDHRVLAKL